MIDFIENMVTEGKIDSIIFQDYDKGVVTPGLITDVIQIANKKAVRFLSIPRKGILCIMKMFPSLNQISRN